MSALRWEQMYARKVYHAYSGDILIGVAMRPECATPTKAWIWYTSSFQPGYGRKSRGEVGTLKTAKTAVERTWNAWLERAALTANQPTPSTQRKVGE